MAHGAAKPLDNQFPTSLKGKPHAHSSLVSRHSDSADHPDPAAALTAQPVRAAIRRYISLFTFNSGGFRGQKTKTAERSVPRHAQGRLLRRKQDSQDPSENGQGGTVEGFESSVRQAREGNPWSSEAASADIWHPRQACPG